jgi:hypothetical protein
VLAGGRLTGNPSDRLSTKLDMMKKVSSAKTTSIIGTMLICAGKSGSWGKRMAD